MNKLIRSVNYGKYSVSCVVYNYLELKLGVLNFKRVNNLKFCQLNDNLFFLCSVIRTHKKVFELQNHIKILYAICYFNPKNHYNVAA